METLIGTIDKVLFESEKDDYKVIQVRLRDRMLIRATGSFPNIVAGAKVELHGNYRNHHKYGVGFNVESHTFAYDSNERSMVLYLQAIAKWIGPERSWALVKKFGTGL